MRNATGLDAAVDKLLHQTKRNGQMREECDVLVEE